MISSLISEVLDRIRPKNNPIIIKELRSRMRGSRAYLILTSVLIIMALISYAIYQIVLLSSSWTYSPLSPQVGQTLFATLALLEMMMVCMITPAVTANAISTEYEKQTYEMLLATPLNPTRILWGKLISALSYIFLLVFAAIPIGSLVFIYGGVAPRDMLKALILLICTAVLLGSIGIFVSTLFKRSGRATITSYLITLIMISVPTISYGLIGIIQQSEPPRWLLIPSPINALFSAIAPSTSLNNASLGLFGGLSMVMGGNLVQTISIDSIPRPIYHHTLPLYGLLALVLFFLSTRLIRPVRRWRMQARELILPVIIIILFLGIVWLAFSSTADRYENIHSSVDTILITALTDSPSDPDEVLTMDIRTEIIVEIWSMDGVDNASLKLGNHQIEWESG